MIILTVTIHKDCRASEWYCMSSFVQKFTYLPARDLTVTAKRQLIPKASFKEQYLIPGLHMPLKARLHVTARVDLWFISEQLAMKRPEKSLFTNINAVNISGLEAAVAVSRALYRKQKGAHLQMMLCWAAVPSPVTEEKEELWTSWLREGISTLTYKRSVVRLKNGGFHHSKSEHAG